MAGRARPVLSACSRKPLTKGETHETLDRDIREKLLGNGRVHQQCDETGEPEPDFVPVVKLFTPDAGCTWLLTEIDPENPDIAYGLCDLGLGCPELGSVSLSELARRCPPTPTRRGRMARSLPRGGRP
jgi:Protein of unknown function (DUF2958)